MSKKKNWKYYNTPLAFFFYLYQYPAALMNLGAILHLNGKLKEAEENYLLALQLKPDDVITQSNLRKLWNIMEKQGLKTSKTWFSLKWLNPRTGTSTQLSGQRTCWTWLQGSEVLIAARRSYSAREIEKGRLWGIHEELVTQQKYLEWWRLREVVLEYLINNCKSHIAYFWWVLEMYTVTEIWRENRTVCTKPYGSQSGNSRLKYFADTVTH